MMYRDREYMVISPIGSFSFSWEVVQWEGPLVIGGRGHLKWEKAYLIEK